MMQLVFSGGYYDTVIKIMTPVVDECCNEYMCLKSHSIRLVTAISIISLYV